MEMIARSDPELNEVTFSSQLKQIYCLFTSLPLAGF